MRFTSTFDSKATKETRVSQDSPACQDGQGLPAEMAIRVFPAPKAHRAQQD